MATNVSSYSNSPACLNNKTQHVYIWSYKLILHGGYTEAVQVFLARKWNFLFFFFLVLWILWCLWQAALLKSPISIQLCVFALFFPSVPRPLPSCLDPNTHTHTPFGSTAVFQILVIHQGSDTWANFCQPSQALSEREGEKRQGSYFWCLRCSRPRCIKRHHSSVLLHYLAADSLMDFLPRSFVFFSYQESLLLKARVLG